MVSESFVQKQYLISCQSIQNPISSQFITFCDIVGGSGYFWLVEKISCTWKSLKYEVCSSVRVGWTFHHTLVVYTSGQWSPGPGAAPTPRRMLMAGRGAVSLCTPHPPPPDTPSPASPGFNALWEIRSYCSEPTPI